MIYIFFRIWSVFAFPSQTTFQYVTSDANKMAAERDALLSLCVSSLSYLFITESFENSLVCLERSQHGIDRLKFP